MNSEGSGAEQAAVGISPAPEVVPSSQKDEAGGAKNQNSASSHWEWDGPGQKQADGLLHYRACKHVLDQTAPPEETRYCVGDIVYSLVDDDLPPWVAQILDFCWGELEMAFFALRFSLVV